MKRGLLQKIEVRQNDTVLSALKLTFHNGSIEYPSPLFGLRQPALDTTIGFQSAVRKIVFTYNTGVVQV